MIAVLLALIITFDQGGRIIDYMIAALEARNRHEIVVIDGYCASACTLHLINPRSCATKRAKLLFHAASNRVGTKFAMSQYPPKVRAYIIAHGGLTKRSIIVRGVAAQKLIGAC